MSVLNYIILFVQFASCCVAIYYWPHYKNKSIWIFLPFLVYTFLNELLAMMLSFHFRIRNYPMYNVYLIVSFCVYLYWFDQLLRLHFWKWIILLLFSLVVIYDIFIDGFSNGLLKNTLYFQAVLMLTFSLAYFSNLLRRNEVIHYQNLPEFWIVTGLLMFYIGFIPLSIANGTIKMHNTYMIAINILNYVLYGCYIIAFYVSGRR